MMMTKPRMFGAICVCLLMVQVGPAYGEAGVTGMEFLKIGVGPRAVAMGGAYTAVADDVYSMYWNPAGLGRMKTAEITFQNNQFITDIDQNYLAVAMPMQNAGTIGFSANVVSIEGLKRTTITSGMQGKVLGTFGSQDLSACVGWGIRLPWGVTFGALAQLINSKIDGFDATASAGDVGIQIQPMKAWRIGVAVKNIGRGGKFVQMRDDLPRAIRVGTAIMLLPERNLVFSMDINKPKADDLFLNVGIEYTLMGHLSFRGGYTQEQRDVDKGLTAGMGIRFSILSLDYAYVPFGILDNTHRVSLTIRLGGKPKE